MNSYTIPEQLGKEIDELEMLIAQYKEGTLSAKEVKAHRVPFGVYEQRQKDTYMVRIRCAAGIVTPSQLNVIANLSSRYGDEYIHLTTRQELQIHYVKLEKVIPILRALRETGLASRGGGGNTVRNIIAQEDAGICADEVFDVTPYAVALTTRLIEQEDSWTLPRKFKIAFSGSWHDKGCATVADLGFIAVTHNGVQGFRVYAAGGMGAKSQEGHLFLEFIGKEDVYAVTKAVKNVFWKYGNRKNKHAARLRFLWKELGESEFRKKFQEELDLVRKENVPPLEVEEIPNKAENQSIEPVPVDDPQDFALWKKRFVSFQKQQGLAAVLVPVELGFIKNEQVAKIAQFLIPYGDNVMRLTREQNLVLRNIPEANLTNVYKMLKETLPNFNRPVLIDKIVSCAGASTCQLGICLSRGAASALIKALGKSGLELDNFSDVRINISGCPNSCGQHSLADIGFFGKASRKEEKLYPAYYVLAGAVIEEGKTRFAQRVGEVNARDLPRLVIALFREYADKGKGTFQEYIRAEGKKILQRLCEEFGDIPLFDEDKNYYYDWGAETPFSLADRGAGECSAGLFDLIEMDRDNIRQAKEALNKAGTSAERQNILYNLVLYSSRMLLITRAIEPKNEEDVFAKFTELFITTGLIPRHFEPLIQKARQGKKQRLEEQEVFSLTHTVEELYNSMDNSFNFKRTAVAGVPSLTEASPESESQEPGAVVHRVKDFRGVACPMNFVKTKIELSQMAPDEILEIYLDDGPPIENVPGSVREEGHSILSQKKKENYWQVIIQKKGSQ